jgi:hypothetical protein
LDNLKELSAELDKKLITLQRLFDDYFDLHPHNIFINIHSKQLYLFDLSKFPKQEK